AMPGPILACARSTGAILPENISIRAFGNSSRRESENARRDVVGASWGRGRHTNTIDDAKAFRITFTPVVNSVRIGHVPLIANPALMRLVSIVSHPVLAALSEPPVTFSVSACLKA